MPLYTHSGTPGQARRCRSSALLAVLSIAVLGFTTGSPAGVPDAPLSSVLLQFPAARSAAREGEDGSVYGSGILTRYRSSIFLVATRHALLGTNAIPIGPKVHCLTQVGTYSPETNKIEFVIDLRIAQATRELRVHEKRDVAAVRVGAFDSQASGSPNAAAPVRFELRPFAEVVSQIPMGQWNIANLDSATPFRDAAPGDDIYTVGFPISMGIRSPQISPLEPLVSKTVIAGKNARNRTLILDSTGQPGQREGGVWKATQLGQDRMGYGLVGLVTQIIPTAQLDSRPNPAPGASSSGPYPVAGYSVAEPVDTVMEVIGTFDDL